AVEHKNIEVPKGIHRIVRDRFEIGSVSKIVKAISDDWQFAVNDLNGGYFDVAEAKWRIVCDRMRNKLRQSAADMRWFKNVFKDPPKILPRDLVGIDAHSPVSEIERTNVIEPEDVIDMAMRDQYSVEIFDV